MDRNSNLLPLLGYNTTTMSVLLSLFFLGISADSNAAGACRGTVISNCDEHYAEINGQRSTINCGRATRPASGRIGRARKAYGTVFPSMKGAPVLEMVPPPGSPGVVIHKMPPFGNSMPVGHNRSAGCVHVGPQQLALLQRCKGTPYKLIFTSKGRYSSKVTPASVPAGSAARSQDAKSNKRKSDSPASTRNWRGAPRKSTDWESNDTAK